MNTLNKNLSVVESRSYGGATFEVLAYDKLDGAQDMHTAMGLYFVNQVGLQAKQVKITHPFRPIHI